MELEADPSLSKRSGSTIKGTKSFRPFSVLSFFPRFGSRVSKCYSPNPDALLAQEELGIKIRMVRDLR